MKKLKIYLMFLSIATLILIGAVIQEKENNLIVKEEIPFSQAYEDNLSKSLDNVYIDGNDIILPFIFTNKSQKITVSQMNTYFANAGLTVKSISTGEKICTGTKIEVNENNYIYNVVIYGDVNGDGNVNTIDALKIILYYKNPAENPLSGIYLKAANVSNRDNSINTIDALRIILFYKNNQQLVVDKPITAVEKNEAIQSIEMYTNPKLVYSQGESLRLNGAKIKVSWINKGDTYINITDNMLSSYDLNTLGDQVITVTYLGKTTTFTISVLEPVADNSGIQSIEIANAVSLYTEIIDENESFSVREGDEYVYTVMPITFKNEDNREVNVSASYISINPNNSATLLQDSNRVVITIPNGMSAMLYDKDGNVATGSTFVEKIGLAFVLNDTIKIPDVDGKKAKIECKAQAKQIDVTVVYRNIKVLNLDTTYEENTSVDAEQSTVVLVDENIEFTLGKLVLGRYEGPLTIDMVEFEVKNALNETIGSNIFHIEAEGINGEVFIKGKITTKGIYQLKITLKNNINTEENIVIRAKIPTPTVGSVVFQDLLNNTGITNNTVNVVRNTDSGAVIGVTPKTASGASIASVKMENVQISNENSDIIVLPYDETYHQILDGQTQKEFRGIEIRTTSAVPAGATRTISITIFGHTETLTLNITD